MSSKVIQTLELDKILQLVKPYAVSKLTHAKIDEIQPSFNLNETKIKLQQTQEAHEIYFKHSCRPLTEFVCISEILELSKIASILQIFQLRMVLTTLKAGRIAQKAILNCPLSSEFEPSLLKSIASEFKIETDLEKSMDNAIISDTELSDNASPKLREIRRKLASSNAKLREKLNSFTRNNEISKYLQDNLFTLRNGRYVVPVKSECRANVQGLIHDRSSTGATLFIEPFAMVELNNEIKALQMDENAEIERILAQLTQGVQINAENIASMQESLVKLDLIFSRLRFCIDYNCNKPNINTQGEIKLINSRHPLIAKDKVVPVTVILGQQVNNNKCKILNITGPNTGGKTVCLKTVGLFCLLTYCGFYIPADEGSNIAIFDNIYADIGDEQSITSSLSTFSAHIINIAHITSSITKDSLVLFDELGAGTDPHEGVALAIGIVKYIQQIGSSAIITTHYSELKEYALTSNGILNASMQFSQQTLSPTYKLILGTAGSSNALKIAKNLGINEQILKSAYDSIPKSKLQFELVLSEAENAKRLALDELSKYQEETKRVEQLRIQLTLEKEKLERRLESINQNAKAEVGRLVSKSMDKVDELIETLKEEIKTRDESALLKAKQALKKMQDIKYENERETISALYDDIDPETLKEGDEVIIKSMGITGKVVRIDKAKFKASILAGAVIANVPLDNLAKPSLKAPTPNRSRLNANINPVLPASMEIKVLGLTVIEAIDKIEPIIESLINANGGTLRIIHGKGTGALGRGIRQYLKTNKNISSFEYAGYHEGGSGVTVVKIDQQ